MTKVYLADIHPLTEESRFRSLFDRVPRDRQEKVTALRFLMDRCRSLGGWVLLERALEQWGVTGELNLSRNEYGKPYLKDYPHVHFSLSHSGSKVLCAISTGEVGCDIQKGGRADLRLADRFFSPREAEALKTMDDRSFYRLWTLKESYIKAVGMGLALPLRDFSLDISGKTPCLEINPFPEKTFFFREFSAGEDYFCACCASGGEIEGLIRMEL